MIALQFFQKRLSGLLQPLFEAPSAIAIGAGPGFSAVFMAAISSRMSVLHLQQFKIFLPVRPFFIQRRGAETGFNPVSDALLVEPGVPQIVNVFFSRNRAAAQRPIGNGVEQGLFASGFESSLHQITHTGV